MRLSAAAVGGGRKRAELGLLPHTAWRPFLSLRAPSAGGGEGGAGAVLGSRVEPGRAGPLLVRQRGLRRGEEP